MNSRSLDAAHLEQKSTVYILRSLGPPAASVTQPVHTPTVITGSADFPHWSQSKTVRFIFRVALIEEELCQEIGPISI